MHYYPLFLDLSQARILLAGAGEVGRRKAGDLLAVGPKALLWLDPAVPPQDLPADLVAHPALEYAQREARPRDLSGRALVFAATGSAEANLRLARQCREQGIFCNVADAPDEGNFMVPTHFYQDGFCLALSTAGQSPALARQMRRELQDWYQDRYSAMLTLLGRLRPLILRQIPGKENSGCRAELFRNLAQSALTEALQDKDRAGTERLLRDLLPEKLHKQIEDLLHDLY
ncbi:MAG: bifunctional precorrin-2 dehydrogenase/sirohydrochlorin ferrochelatase [Desulfovibrionaceae bacterium]|nr:bifunctional precorrin-2 dehydrogenase/sirohydrochlorin ferrochelatase [Desulfovibrionaceae bacterium]